MATRRTGIQRSRSHKASAENDRKTIEGEDVSKRNRWGTAVEIAQRLRAEWIRRGLPALDRDRRRDIAIACGLPGNAHAICGRWGFLSAGHREDIRIWR